jgi:tetratricopeptide (TPR) repeat protein
MGELDEALSQCQAADAVVLGAQLRVPRGRVLIQLAATHLARGSLDDAVSVGLESLAVQRETGQRLGEARTLAGLAAAHRALGDEPAALEHWTAALEIFDDLNPVEAAKVRGQLAG